MTVSNISGKQLNSTSFCPDRSENWLYVMELVLFLQWFSYGYFNSKRSEGNTCQIGGFVSHFLSEWCRENFPACCGAALPVPVKSHPADNQGACVSRFSLLDTFKLKQHGPPRERLECQVVSADWSNRSYTRRWWEVKFKSPSPPPWPGPSQAWIWS